MRRAVLLAVVLLFGWVLGPSGLRAARMPAPHLAEAEIAYAEGLAAFHAGRWEEAADWLAESARLNPREGAPRYWRGLALLRLGRSEEAAGEIAASLAARHPPDVERARLRKDLEAARRAPAGEAVPLPVPEELPPARPIDDRGAWEGVVGLGIASDSNPNLLSAELVLPPLNPKPGELIRGEAGDRVARPALSLALYPWHDRPGPTLGVTLSTGRSFHQDFGFLDLGEAHGAVQVAFGSDPRGFLEGALGHARVPFGSPSGGDRFSALLQAGGSDYRVDGSLYLRTWEGAAALAFHEAAATATRLDLGYADREFGRGALVDPARSGKDVSAGLSQLLFLGNPDRWLRLGGRTVERSAGRPYAESIREGNAELSLPLALRWTAHLEASVRKDDFDHPESNLFVLGGPARDDTTKRTALALVWKASPRLRWTARGTWVRRSSNVSLGDGLPDLGYRRTLVSLNGSWVF